MVEAGCLHQPKVVGALKPRDLPEARSVNTALSTLKTSLVGAFRSLNYRMYAHRQLAAFAQGFNRRFDPHGLVARLIVDLAHAKPSKNDR